METIAVTSWNDIVSPLYDAACTLLIVAPDGRRKTLDVRDLSLFDKAAACRREGVSVLLCGAISDVACAMLADKGIRVCAWIRGPVNELIAAYRQHADLTEAYAMPGCRRRMHRQPKTLPRPGGRCLRRPS